MDIFQGENLIMLIKAVGLIGLFAIVFAESGLFIGFFLPGDSLLFTGGFLASQGYFNIFVLALIVFIAAVLGDSVGYAFGKKVGPKIFSRKDSLLFKKDNIIKAQKFYEKHGVKTIILARFVPIVRTFAPIVAGIGNMEYKTFITYNVIGGFGWAFAMTYAGYFLGSIIPDVDKYLLPILVLIVFLSLLPTVFEFIKARRESKANAVAEKETVA